MLNYLLFAVYGIAFCWLIVRMPFIKKAGIDSRLILALFLLKIIAGVAIGWIALHQYGPGNDYWDVNRESWNEYQLLLSNPKEYFTNLFSSGYPDGYAGVFDSFHSFWNDLRNNMIIKLVSVFNIFSRGDYYINSLFFNFIIFFGHVALYRVFTKVFAGQNKLLIVCCFLLPSMLYFTSGIHKDGIVFLMLALICYTIFNALQKKSLSWKAMTGLLFCFIILFLVRNFVFIALVPALIAWILATKFKWRAWKTFAVVYIIAGLLLFNIHYLFSGIDPLATIVQKQTDYSTLPISSTPLPVTKLEPNFTSFAANAPQSLNHLLLRPYLWELPVKTLLPLNIELFCYQVLFLLFLFFPKKNEEYNNKAFTCFGVFFSLAAFLFIGYIVPNLGSLVRYRSIYLPFLMTPVICSIDWKRLLSRKDTKTA